MNCFHLKAVSHIGYKKPRALRGCQSFLEERADILTFTLPVFTRCRKPKGENANENIHSHWSHDTRETFGSVVVVAHLGASNPEKIFLFCSVNRTVAGWLCVAEGRKALAGSGCGVCSSVVGQGNRLAGLLWLGEQQESCRRLKKGTLKGIHLFFFSSYANKDVGVVITVDWWYFLLQEGDWQGRV